MQVLAFLGGKARKQSVANLVVDERQAGPVGARPDQVTAARLRHGFHDATEILACERARVVQIEAPAEHRSGREQPLCCWRKALDPTSRHERGAPRRVSVGQRARLDRPTSVARLQGPLRSAVDEAMDQAKCPIALAVKPAWTGARTEVNPV